MSQNAGAQDRITPGQPKSSTPNQPDSRLLDVAIVIYLIALAAFVALTALGIHAEANELSATVLLIVPLALLGTLFGLLYSVSLLSSLAGVPLVSFSSGFSVVQRNWRRIVTTVLLLAVLCAMLPLVTS